MSRRKKYSLNDDFLNEINSENTAYFLGLMYSDGFIKRENEAIIELSERDLDILEQCTEILESNRPLVYMKDRSDEKRVRKPTYIMIIRSKRIYDNLLKYGVIRKKSKVITFPSFISETELNHFVRGVFDGDGCFSMGNGNNIIATISSASEKFIFPLVEVLNQILLIDGKIYRCTNGVYNLTINKKDDVIKFINWLYDGSTIYGKRKHNLAVVGVKGDV